jgi:hypothetical protein
MWLLSDVMHASHRLAIGVMVVLIPAFNYACNRFWVFRTGLQRPKSQLDGKSSEFTIPEYAPSTVRTGAPGFTDGIT